MLLPAGPWFLYSSDSTGQEIGFPVARFMPNRVEAMRAWIEARQGRYNLYYSPNNPLPIITKHPTKAEIVYLNFIHLDLDLPKNSAYSPPTEANLKRLLDRVESLVPRPHLLVFSGGGYQALWRLDQPLPAMGYAERVEAVNQAIERAVSGDHCWNINRVLRLPGTINTPDAKKLSKNPGRIPALSYIVRADWETRWSFDSDAVPTLVLHQQNDDEEEELDSKGKASAHSLDSLSKSLQRDILTGDASKYGGDRSSLVWKVIFALIRMGWTDDEIKPFLLDPAYPLSKHCCDQKVPAAYAQRQLDRARAQISADWTRSGKTGEILTAWPDNLRRGADLLGLRFAFDAFEGQPYVNGAGPLRRLTDAEVRNLRVAAFPAAHGFTPPKQIWQDVVDDLAWQASYHPVVEYLNRVQPLWDGRSRIDTWLIVYGGVKLKTAADCEETEDPALAASQYNNYVRAVGRLMLVAACRRVRQPGCKFDEMMVFVNQKQGTNKSSALAVLAVKKDWFIDSLPLHAKDQEVIEKLSGKWIVEFAELVGLRTSEIEHLKAFLSRDTDHARAAYGHYTQHPMRQCVFFASTNEPSFLKDTEDRRFWPIAVGVFDLGALARDRDQLWAEAAAVEATGEAIRLDPALWDAAAAVQAEHRIEDPWVPLIADVLGDLNGSVPSAEAWHAVGKPGYQRTQEDNRRFGAAMRALGWERNTARIDGQPAKAWQRGTPEERRRRIYVMWDPLGNLATAGYDRDITANIDAAFQRKNAADQFDPPF